MVNLKNSDLYLIFGVAPDATEKEIVKAYRKKALKCHPDKNPDNPKAAEEFQELSKALEVLTDAAARAAYDKTLKAKNAAELRHRELDSKRKKFKEDLEARENAAQDYKAEQSKLVRNFQDEVERLRKEGSRLVEEEQARLAEELKKEEESAKSEISEDQSRPAPRLKVKWKAKKGDPENGGYSEDFLMEVFCKYGEVTVLLVSSKKNGSAIVELSTQHAAMLVVQHEIGLPSNPLTLSWLSGQPGEKIAESHVASANELSASFLTNQQQDDGGSGGDFESLVLRRLRQAEERRKLTEQIQEEDGES